MTRKLSPFLATGLALAAACADGSSVPTAPSIAPTINTVALRRDRIAILDAGKTGPVLVVRDLDGRNADTLHFTGVLDRVDGNYDFLPVTDDEIYALGPAKWSPDGQQLAVVVTLGFDQSEVVVMNADGNNARTVSPNQQIIVGDVDWSPDSKMIAYTMSTRPGAGGVELFATDLRTDRVRRLTFGLFQLAAEYRWDEAGRGLYVSRVAAYDEATGNLVNDIDYVDYATATRSTVATKILGEVHGIARSGAWALVRRAAGEDRDGILQRELVVAPVTGATERVVARGANVGYAELLEGDREAMITVDVDADPYSVTWDYGLYGLFDGSSRRIAEIAPSVSSIAVLRAGR